MASYNHTDHLALSVPNRGACYFLDHIVHKLAAETKADVLVLDPQDFVFLAQHSFSRDAATILPLLSSIDPESNALLALGQNDGDSNMDDEDESIIDKAEGGGAVEKFKKDEDEESEEESYEDEEEDEEAAKIHNSRTVELDLADLFDETSDKDNEIHKVSKAVLNQVSTKYTHMFKHLLAASEGEKIIYLRDFGAMKDAFTRIMLKSLVTAVEELRQKGQKVMIVASHCNTNQNENYYIPAIANMRRISVLPLLQDEVHLNDWKTVMKSDEERRITEINAKQLLAMYSQKSPLDIERSQDLLKDLLGLNNISKSIWSPSDVDRRVTTAIGHALEHNKTDLDFEDFKVAHGIVEQVSDLKEKTWKQFKNIGTPLVLQKDGSVDMNVLKRSCNEYEKKLLGRMVDPSKVQGSFKDVRAPPLTIDSLQSLISLPLIRPDLFKKGILKKNFIPGVLLFGPPGTGKTMLAKAVAKDSGSRMLDIQASDVYDMYVGQGEKNVKAVFSLARKLSPCVVFIDEVDSLMNKRGSDYSSKSHREIINQFMVEWDGLSSNNQGVIVMAATNRPFDLDDAVLRRMPRRILGNFLFMFMFDLPNVEDRAEILNILLKDEEHQISVEELAKKTEHYSGSDLKNVCVTAALTAVQQQVKTNMSQSLNMDHFNTALKMVPPSSSEEMDSLIEIRKWDAKFGDGKKKKKSNIGFSD
ncbi:P-loop containing nucleoside triphosphate hydrolase protein [Mucor mucedo]|uniref:P-loop containing nucleoside triphosphate hydrolase protein n=1 Tax=Mucor mucedo TaxID=29922 RepID=UPI002220B39E|nr:P-loop containing nucleoside triphosphate hydrolase protein [Mucor mucedo]KAI7868665.1 P-loop containing nucleoside triphosphate hydrolase protein [Mucor mucedo]